MPEEVPLTEDESRLERMRSRLYAPTEVAPLTPPPLTPAQPQFTSPAWEPPPPPKQKKKFSWTVLFLGASAVFFVVALGASFFFLLRGGLSVSNNNIIITIQPSSPTIASGSTVEFDVSIQNKNPAAISNADITLSFPDGTRSTDDVTQPLLRYVNTIGTIPAGGTVTRTVRAVLFGSVNQAVSIPATFEYNTANSNALFTKQQTTALTINSSPLVITAQAVSSVASGQPFTIALNVRSNASTPLNNIAVLAQYPSGFSAQRVQMSSQNGAPQATPPTTTTFALGTLAPGQERSISITGVLNGTDNNLKDFQFTVGTLKTDGTPGLSVAYASQATDVTISKPFLAVSLSLNHGNTDPTVVTAGDAVAGMITWLNSLTTSISNAQVAITFSGNAFDPSKISTANGYYNSATKTITFTSQTEGGLALLNPNDTGNGLFTLSTKSGTALNDIQNPTVQMAVTVSGNPTGGSPETISNTLINTIRVATDLELASKIVHTVGPFSNSGPWPPVPNQATTYTVELAVTNTVNSIGGATASMILPPYVNFTGKETSSTGLITYDDASRTVTWKIGDVPAGTLAKPITGAFQISLLPSVSQSQSVPILVGNQTLIGTDRFTGAQVGNTAQALTTQTFADPAYTPAFGTVGN